MYDNKLDSMTRTVNMLDAKRGDLDNTYGTALAVSLREAKRVAGVAIDTLKGQNLQPGDINPWKQALADDDYCENAWIPLADQTYQNMQTALGISNNWSVSATFAKGDAAFIDAVDKALPTTGQALAGISMLAIIVVAVAIVVVFK